jgi:hypothetical protein
MPATATGRGAQVLLTGAAQAAARGAAAPTMQGNLDAMSALMIAGYVADGTTPDGTTRTGQPAYDEVIAAFAP